MTQVFCVIYKKIKIIKNHQNSNFSLAASLTTVTRLEAKRSGTQPPFCITITNLPVECSFWGSNECRSRTFSFLLSSICLLHPTKPYRGINFPYDYFLSAAYLDATEHFRVGYQKRFSHDATVRGILAIYMATS